MSDRGGLFFTDMRRPKRKNPAEHPPGERPVMARFQVAPPVRKW
jgi:hypothetical protein